MKKSVLFLTALLFAVFSMGQNLAIQRIAGFGEAPSLLGPLTGAAGPITGPATVCRLVTGVAYSIPVIPDATSYVWTMPPGATIATGSGTNSITVNFPAGSQSGIMMVYGTGPTGPGAPAFLAITVLGPNLSGNTTPCKLSTDVYTTEAGKTAYSWTFNGAQKIAGGSATDNTITLKWIASGNRWVKVQYTDGTCTSNTTLPVVVQNSQPTLTGPSASCKTHTETYTTESGMVAGSYVWTISPGNLVTSGGGPNDATCTVKWQVSGAQSVQVTYTSPLGCAITPTSVAVTVWDLPVPSLTGSAGPFCSGAPAVTYTTDAGKKDYTWSVSPGNTIVSGGGLNDNTIQIQWIASGPQSVSVNYTDKHGVYYLCTAASPTVLNVTVNPLPVPSITGSGNICGVPSAGNTYSTEPGMSGYIWNVSGGGTIVGPTNTNSVSVTWSALGPQWVSVTYTNAAGCSAATPTVKNINVNNVPNPSLNGPAAVCVNSAGNVYLTEAGQANYIWSVPTGGNITSGGGLNDNSVTVTWTASGTHSVSVNYQNAQGCFAPSSTVYLITVTPDVGVPVFALGASSVRCQGAGSVTYSATASDATSIVYSLDGVSTGAGNAINPLTGEVTYVAGWSGVSTITATATGCGPVTQATHLATTTPNMNLSETHTDVLCNGGSTGSIDLTVAGGTAPYSYLWSNGATTEDISGLAAGPYSVTVTDANSCTASLNVTINEPADLVLSETHVNVLCNGAATGSIDLTVAGGVAPYTYSWSNGATTEDISNLTAGNYNVTVTDANLCTETLSVTITEPSALLLTETHVNVLCNGASTGSIDLTVSGGIAPYTYSWSTGDNTEDISNLSAGNYTVTVTDANLCTDNLMVTITEPPALNLSETHVDVACNGGNTGSINLTVAGGVAPYTYAWSNGDNTEDISNLSAGNYSVTVTDANLCTDNLSVTITEPPALVLSETHVNVLCNGAATGSIDLTVAGGVAPYTYSWSNGATTEDISGLTAGAYTVVVTDANLCTETLTATITEPPALVLSETHVNVLCNGAATGSIDLTVAGGVAPYTYAWSNGATTEDISGLTAGAYTVVVTDANLCTKNLTVTITEPPALVLSETHVNVLCNGAATGSIDLTVAGGVAPYTYAWSNGDNTEDISNLSAGNYSVTVTDANLCTDNLSVTITEPPALVLSETHVNVLCNGAATGSIDLTVAGGVAPYTYSWSNGATTEDISGLTAGAYTVVVTDANLCTETLTVTITEPPALIPVATSNSPICEGSTLDLFGSATGGVPPYDYNWLGPNGFVAISTQNPSIPNATAAASGTYILFMTDGNGCGEMTTTNVTVYPTPTINPVPNVTYCNGAVTAEIPFSGPVAGTTFAWTNDTPSIGLGASGNGNVPSFTATNPGITPEVATITVTPTANGCPGTPISFTITVFPTATVDPVANQTYCHGDITAAMTFTGPVVGTTYAWVNNDPSIGLPANGTGGIPSFVATNNGTAPVVATVTVTPSANGCTGTPLNFTFTVNPRPTVNAVANAVYCNGATTAVINFTGPVAGTTFTWTNSDPSIGLAANGAGNIASFTATNAGITPVVATITVTPSANGCTGTPITFTITVNPTPTVNPIANATYCNGATTAPVVITSPVAGTTFAWTNSDPSIGLAANGTGNIPSFTATNPGTAPVIATITVTPSANSCTGTPLTFTITVNPTPTVNPVSNVTYCNGATTLLINFTGPVAGTTFAWTNDTPAIGLVGSGSGFIPSFIATNTGIAPLVATITVTPSANGCVGTPLTFTITVYPTPTANQVANVTYCNGATTAPIAFNGPVAGTTYDWTNSTTSIGLAGSGNGNIPSFTATNAGSAPVVALITVIPTANGCPGIPMTFTITVNPTPTVNPVTNVSYCNGATTAAITINGPVAGTTYTWTNDTPSIGLPANGNGNIPSFIATNPGTAPVVATITVTPAANGCTGPVSTFTITVYPTPSVNPVASVSYCNGANTAPINFSGPVVNTTYGWTNNTPSIGLAASGTGNISSFVATNAGTAPVVATITVTPAANGCTGLPITFTITVFPTPTVNAVSNFTYCNNATTAPVNFVGPVANTTFGWTNNTPSIGLAASGTGNIPSFVATNPGTAPVVATITVTPSANGCTGPQMIFTITVNPTPTLTSTLTPPAICDNALFSYTPTSATTGTTFAWTRAAVGGIANGPNSGSGNPNENLDNTTTLPVAVTYVYTLTANGCTNPTTYNVVVIVNPTPVLTSTLTPPPVCSGTPFTYTPTSSTPGATFTWARTTVVGITPVGTTGGGNINETLTNTTPNPIDVTYVITVIANGCTNPTTYNVVVTINPNPVLTSTLTPPAICSNSVFNYTPTSSTAGTTYLWTRATVTGISPAGTSGAGNISETLINTTTNPINVTYVYTLTANGCTNPATYSVVVTVNPQPVPTITGYTSMCVNIGPLSYTTEPGMAGYLWVASPGNTIESGQGTNQVWINWTVPGNQWISVTYVNSYGCSAATPTVLNISVGPLPDAAGTITGTAAVCGGTQGVSYSVNPIANATNYVWTLPAGASIASGDGTNSITVDFGPFASSGNITVYGNNLCGNGTTSPPFAVNVTPLPDTSGVITGDAEICQGVSGVTYSVDAIANATGYEWTLPAGFDIVAGQNTNSIIVDVQMTAVSGTVTVYGTNSCGNGQLGPAFDVTVNPIPDAPVITQINNETLHSSATTGNLWYFEGAPAPTPNTDQDYHPTQAGEYWCIVVLNGCSSDTSNHIIWPAVGIEPIESSAKLSIYPVPNDGQFKVSINSPTLETYNLKIYNNLGVIIYTIQDLEVSGTTEKSVDLRPTPSGIYTVILENNDKRIIRKILINK